MNNTLKDFKFTHAHLLEKAPVRMDARLKDIFEAVNTFKTNAPTIEADKDFYLGQGLPTFLFIDGVLTSSPQIQGLNLKDSVTLTDLVDGKNRTTVLNHLHHAKIESGFEMTLDKDVLLKTPVRVLRVSTSGQMTFPTLVVKAGKFSGMTLIEENISLDNNNVSLGETHLFVADGAKLDHIQIESHAADSKSAGSTYAHLNRDGVYRNFSFHLIGAITQRALDLHIDGTGAHGESHILYLLNQQEKSNVSTVIHHYTPDSTSAQLAKGILDNDSKGSFTGRIHIHKDAQRVNSSQLNKNLLLSKKAQVFSEPQLEIFADDVKCSHGSTTGQLSPEEVFYFEARGIPHDKARNLLALGFGMEVVMKIDNVEARNYLSQMVSTVLKTKFHLGGAL